ncbi:MAG: FTR1 family protein [Chloroflexota bacterium]|nr:FTR1 family protein [Chloroflexota bacterium]
MDFGSFSTGLLTGLREGVEAALIVTIILAYLGRTGNRRHFGPIWLGTGIAVLLSVAVGALLWITIHELPAPAEQIFEGTTLLVAAGVVTWMLFWMRRTAATVGQDLRAAVDRSLTSGSVWGLAVLAFAAVIREGIETSLFLLGQATAASKADLGASSVLLGALIGLVVAVALGFGFYRGARVLNLRTFFGWTGLALIFVAAGLVASALHEFVEIGWIRIGTATAFDISAIVPHQGGGIGVIGQFLHALFGYTSQPEWITLLTWLAYLTVVIGLYIRPTRPAKSAARPTEQKVAST